MVSKSQLLQQDISSRIQRRQITRVQQQQARQVQQQAQQVQQQAQQQKVVEAQQQQNISQQQQIQSRLNIVDQKAAQYAGAGEFREQTLGKKYRAEQKALRDALTKLKQGGTYASVSSVISSAKQYGQQVEVSVYYAKAPTTKKYVPTYTQVYIAPSGQGMSVSKPELEAGLREGTIKSGGTYIDKSGQAYSYEVKKPELPSILQKPTLKEYFETYKPPKQIPKITGTIPTGTIATTTPKVDTSYTKYFVDTKDYGRRAFSVKTGKILPTQEEVKASLTVTKAEVPKWKWTDPMIRTRYEVIKKIESRKVPAPIKTGLGVATLGLDYLSFQRHPIEGVKGIFSMVSPQKRAVQKGLIAKAFKRQPEFAIGYALGAVWIQKGVQKFRTIRTGQPQIKILGVEQRVGKTKVITDISFEVSQRKILFKEKFIGKATGETYIKRLNKGKIQLGKTTTWGVVTKGVGYSFLTQKPVLIGAKQFQAFTKTIGVPAKAKLVKRIDKVVIYKDLKGFVQADVGRIAISKGRRFKYTKERGFKPEKLTTEKFFGLGGGVLFKEGALVFGQSAKAFPEIVKGKPKLEISKQAGFILEEGKIKPSIEFQPLKSKLKPQIQIPQAVVSTMAPVSKVVTPTPKITPLVPISKPTPKLEIIDTQPTQIQRIEAPSMVGGERLTTLSYERLGLYERTTGGLLPRERQVITPSIKQRITPLIKTRQIQQPKLDTLQKDFVKQFQPPVTTLGQPQKELLKQRQKQLLRLRQNQLQKQKARQIQRIIPTIPKIIIPPKPSSSIAKLARAFAKRQAPAYEVQIRRRGKFVKVGKDLLPLGKALKLGTKETTQSLAQTFRLIKKGFTIKEDIPFKVPTDIFTRPKKPTVKLEFVERRGKTLKMGTGEIGKLLKTQSRYFNFGTTKKKGRKNVFGI